MNEFEGPSPEELSTQRKMAEVRLEARRGIRKDDPYRLEEAPRTEREARIEYFSNEYEASVDALRILDAQVVTHLDSAGKQTGWKTHPDKIAAAQREAERLQKALEYLARLAEESPEGK